MRQQMASKRIANATISIHASARDATASSAIIRETCRNFNPRIREGCDYVCTRWSMMTAKFQSTHPRGMRLFHLFIHYFCVFKFQSTHPRGMRHLHNIPYLLLRPYFNPRIREGCDGVTVEKLKADIIISIHASARDATLNTPEIKDWREKFQSTHPRGMRLFQTGWTHNQ